MIQKRTSTFTKFFISAAIVIIFLALCLTFALRYVIEDSFIQHERESTAEDIFALAKSLKPEDFNFENPQKVQEAFDGFYGRMIHSEIVRIKVWDTNGRIIYSDDKNIIGKSFPEDKEYQKSLQGIIVSAIETRSKAEELYKEKYLQALEVYVPITFNGSSKISGVIEVYSKLDELNHTISQMEIVQIFSTTTFILAAFILFFALFKLFIYKPLDDIISITKSFESGDLSKRAQMESEDEIGRLGAAFNNMASKLQGYYLGLEEQVKERTNELEIAKTHYQSLFEDSPIGIGISTFDGRVVSGNIAMQKMFGYTEKEIKNMNLSEIYKNPEDRDRMLNIFRKEGKVKGFSSIYKRKDGSVFDVLISLAKFHNDGEELIQATIEDVTTQKQAEKKLAEHVKELEKTKVAVLNLMEDLRSAKSAIESAKIKDDAILENIGDGLVVVDLNGNISLINSAGALMLGWKVEELLGQNLEKIVPVEDENGNLLIGEKRPSKEAINFCKTSACSIARKLYCARKDKTKFPVAITAAPIIVNHKTTGVVEVFRDITREKEIDREKTEFLSIAAHQLRTPLGSMRWSFEMLLNGDFGVIPEDIKDMLTNVYKSNQEMISLVNDLLDVSRIDQGRISNNPKLTDVVDILKSTIDQTEIEAKNKEIIINFTRDSEKIPQILIDPLHLHQVITNLVNNAIKYNIYKGKIDINVEKLETSVKITITNTGKSIPADEQHRLFTRFFRGRDAVKNEASGTGLGLYVVKFYVDAWGGKVWAKSPVLGEDQGTTFYLEIPLKPKNN